MITMYKVWVVEKRTEDYIAGMYIDAEDANRHRLHLDETWPDDYHTIELCEVNSLPSQRVLVDGDVIGYQFARSCAGKRTYTRKVTNLQHSDDGTITGVCTIKGRKVLVQHYPGVARHRQQWIAVEVIKDEVNT